MTDNQSTSGYKFRINYKITGQLKFLSHKELMRVIVRAFRRARISQVYSQGYHPHPLFSFGPSLPVGMAGISEQFDVRLTNAWAESELEKKVSNYLPEEMEINNVKFVPLKEPSITSMVTSAIYEIDWPEKSDGPGDFVASMLSLDKIEIERRTGKGNKKIDLRPGIYDIRWQPPKLEMHLALSPSVHVRPSEVLSIMTGWTDDAIKRISVTRTGFMTSPKETGITLRKDEKRNYY